MPFDEAWRRAGLAQFLSGRRSETSRVVPAEPGQQNDLGWRLQHRAGIFYLGYLPPLFYCGVFSFQKEIICNFKQVKYNERGWRLETQLLSEPKGWTCGINANINPDLGWGKVVTGHRIPWSQPVSIWMLCHYGISKILTRLESCNLFYFSLTASSMWN